MGCDGQGTVWCMPSTPANLLLWKAGHHVLRTGKTSSSQPALTSWSRESVPSHVALPAPVRAFMSLQPLSAS